MTAEYEHPPTSTFLFLPPFFSCMHHHHLITLFHHTPVFLHIISCKHTNISRFFLDNRSFSKRYFHFGAFAIQINEIFHTISIALVQTIFFFKVVFVEYHGLVERKNPRFISLQRRMGITRVIVQCTEVQNKQQCLRYYGEFSDAKVIVFSFLLISLFSSPPIPVLLMLATRSLRILNFKSHTQVT